MKKKAKKEKEKNSKIVTNNLIALLAIIIIIFNLSLVAFLYYKTPQLSVREKITGTATGRVLFCINRQPIFDFNNCSGKIYVGESYSCIVNATDPDGQGIIYYDNVSFFDINYSNGHILFTSDEDDAGLHTVLITADDQRNCTNSNKTTTFDLNISDCIGPTYTEFTIPPTTNFSHLLIPF